MAYNVELFDDTSEGAKLFIKRMGEVRPRLIFDNRQYERRHIVTYKANFQAGDDFFVIKRRSFNADEQFMYAAHNLGIRRVPGSIDVSQYGLTYLFGIPESVVGFESLPENIAETYLIAARELLEEGGIVGDVTDPEDTVNGEARRFTRLVYKQDNKQLITELPHAIAFGLVDKIMRS